MFNGLPRYAIPGLLVIMLGKSSLPKQLPAGHYKKKQQYKLSASTKLEEQMLEKKAKKTVTKEQS